jgi:hypothetical protein
MRHSRIGTLLVGVLLFASFGVQAATLERPRVWGYGTKTCRDFVTAAAGWDIGQQDQIAEYLLYRDWFSGLVTGLTLATGIDILHGADVEGGMRRIRPYCEDHPNEDFFTASTFYLKLVGDGEKDSSADPQ